MYPGNALRGVSCPSTGLCVVVGPQGHLFTSTNPTGDAAAWSLVGAPGGGESMNGISCPSPTLCVTGDADQIVTSTDPASALRSACLESSGTGAA